MILDCRVLVLDIPVQRLMTKGSFLLTKMICLLLLIPVLTIVYKILTWGITEERHTMGQSKKL